MVGLVEIMMKTSHSDVEVNLDFDMLIVFDHVGRGGGGGYS